MDDSLIKIGAMKESERLIKDWKELPSEISETMDFNAQNSYARLPHILSIEQIFKIFYSDKILEEIINHTNASFEKKRSKVSVLKERDRSWYSLNKLELLNYIGIIIFMGAVKLPEYSYHWKKETMFASNLVKNTMSINRFKAIGRYLTTGPTEKGDKLSRIRSLSDNIQKVSLENYQPSKEIAIDESMIGFTGRHEFKQYLPMKPTKWGFKAFLLCESKTGYCLKHKFFTGAGQDQFKTRNLCNELLEGFENQNYHVFMDNFYSSLPLFADLTGKGIYATGTIRKTKKGLPDLAIYKKKTQKRIQFYDNSIRPE